MIRFVVILSILILVAFILVTLYCWLVREEEKEQNHEGSRKEKREL